MISLIGDALTAVVGWLGTIVTAFTSETGALYALLPVIVIACGISLVLLGIKVIRKSMWGA